MALNLGLFLKSKQTCFFSLRCIQTSAVRYEDPFYQARYKRIARFTVPNKSSAWDPKHIPKHLFDDYYNYPIHRCPLGIKHAGFWFRDKFHYVKEMEPELIVPDLTDCKLKPYVSYRTPDIHQSEFTAKALFSKVYGPKIVDEYMEGKRPEVEVTNEEIRNARLKARQCCSDMFQATAKEMFEKDDCEQLSQYVPLYDDKYKLAN
ncbi:39S ribosomal protein L41-like protein [Leptotrombidium deliense]|uniref:39S ribosomal protein L41-like protein n=1 Tax=Leptotrombidium deliense TaxID=299467 RepID=A0A443SWU7_9ACAR|nr:39S ribosomal protein L41-like protein [Leptotrombidium deliense]